MNLTPTVRTVLTVIGIAVASLGALQASGELTDLPDWVGIMVVVLSSVLGYLGIVPPQTGGTQQGVVNPSLTEPPAIDRANGV